MRASLWLVDGVIANADGPYLTLHCLDRRRYEMDCDAAIALGVTC